MAKNKTKLVGEVINPKNITPTRYGMGVEGKKSPKKKNKLVGKAKKRFELQLKLKTIKKDFKLEKRVKFLPPPPPLPVLRKPTFDIVVIPPPAPKKV